MKANRQPKAAHTLLELLVAATCAALLAGLMLFVSQQLLADLGRQQSRALLASRVQFALDCIARDLQSAVLVADGRPWLAVSATDDTALLAGHGWRIDAAMKPGGETSTRGLNSSELEIASCRFARSGCWLRLTAPNAESALSSPTVISYQIVRRPESGSLNTANPLPIRYRLHRSSVSPQNSFVTGYDLGAPDYTKGLSSTPAERSARSVVWPSVQTALLDNVVDFGIRLHCLSGSGGLEMLWPTSAEPLGYGGPQPGRSPIAVDVMIRILEPQGAELVDAIERGRVPKPSANGDFAQWWWAVVEEHSRVYVRHLRLTAQAP